ncbi:hypothetical protein BpHYR1_002617 [Brachionus plicatilis]|uniref:Uncharacterized protein n=1 Tax=Brachionus plicatilis TaxID=10195 RepID=A0A3M7SF27_BRAPC|nr:hypothetical protein BpHYR1_002617 [Brachionus plicatilis]
MNNKMLMILPKIFLKNGSSTILRRTGQTNLPALLIIVGSVQADTIPAEIIKNRDRVRITGPTFCWRSFGQPLKRSTFYVRYF